MNDIEHILQTHGVARRPFVGIEFISKTSHQIDGVLLVHFDKKVQVMGGPGMSPDVAGVGSYDNVWDPKLLYELEQFDGDFILSHGTDRPS
jgi:hypothetical protein